MPFSILDGVLRALLFAFLVIILGLSGSLRSQQHESNPQVNFAYVRGTQLVAIGCFNIIEYIIN